MRHKLFLLALVTCFAQLISCDGDDDNEPSCSTNWSVGVQTELNAAINAGNAYANDPSAANCASYKASYQAYINALKPYGNCSALTGQSRADFNAALQDAEDNLDSIC